MLCICFTYRSTLWTLAADAIQAIQQLFHWQTATVFQDAKGFVAKPYKFKVQSVTEDETKRKTFAKTTINLAEYCHSSGNSKEVVIHLE